MQINKRELAFLHEVITYPGAMNKHTTTAKSLQVNGLICYEWHSNAADTGAWYATPEGKAYASNAIDAEMPPAPEPEPAPEQKRKAGRPAKYSSNVERQAAYNQRKRDAKAQAEDERRTRVANRRRAANAAQIIAAEAIKHDMKRLEKTVGAETADYLNQIIKQLMLKHLYITIDET